ncbi:hypothetical protein SAMN02745248_00572 [Hathewaya proteolytica DSM 3090]|uniref:BhlA holin family protein n=1 Tax=Hathewaya proteolytica DSM 3090 TaxID=1121331 RepID=A0A1M6L0A5_9CLOT|nr:hypothetical protein [Hathewaya proteolytica]SHJ64562.1 hypothetical protein SAMN02745248_00572 [Hathewaya proteolytica DSM 3090]
MDTNAITTLISNLGFPIVLVLGCMYFMYKKDQQQREDNNKREDRLYSQLDNFSKTMENFNKTLTSIDTRLSQLESKDK